VAALLALGLWTPPAHAAEPAGEKYEQNFVYSAVGPGAGHGAISMGGRVFLIVPTFDLNYARGITDEFNLLFNLSTLGIISLMDLGVRYRLLGNLDSGFSLALKGAVTAAVLFVAAGSNAAGGGIFGATPGIVASFGGRRTQFSIGADVPIVFAGGTFFTGGNAGGSAGTTDTIVLLRPTATLEFPVGETTNMYVQAQFYSVLAPSNANTTFVGPIFAVGAVW
jgi:hypothetical protein